MRKKDSFKFPCETVFLVHWAFHPGFRDLVWCSVIRGEGAEEGATCSENVE